MSLTPKQAQNPVTAFLAKLRTISHNGFIRSVGVLAGGTALAQGLMVLILPVLTRLYTPSDFEVLAVYASVLGIVSAIACLRLEIAIPLPDRDEDAANLLALSLGSSMVVAAVVGLMVWSYPTEIVRLLDQSALLPYLWLLPLGVWLTSSYTALQFWATRKKEFSSIAKTRVSQAISGAGTQVGLGWAGVAPIGLLLGHMMSSGAGLLTLGRSVLRNDRLTLQTVSMHTMLGVLHQYKRYPKYSTLEAFANTTGVMLPLIIIAAVTVGPEAGFLMLATRVMAVPMSLVGGAVGQVYLSRASEELRSGRLDVFTLNVLGGLAKGIGPLVFIGIIASPSFALIFGKEWERAGELVAWIIPWLVFQLLSSPISMVMHVRNWQKAILLLTSAGLALRAGGVWIAAESSVVHLSEVYAIASAIFYFACYWIFSRAAFINAAQMFYLLRKNIYPILAWAFGGLLLRMTVELVLV